MCAGGGARNSYIGSCSSTAALCNLSQVCLSMNQVPYTFATRSGVPVGALFEASRLKVQLLADTYL